MASGWGGCPTPSLPATSAADLLCECQVSERLRPCRGPPRAVGEVCGRGLRAEPPRPAQWMDLEAPPRLLLPPSVGSLFLPASLHVSRNGADPLVRQHHLRIPEAPPPTRWKRIRSWRGNGQGGGRVAEGPAADRGLSLRGPAWQRGPPGWENRGGERSGLLGWRGGPRLEKEGRRQGCVLNRDAQDTRYQGGKTSCETGVKSGNCPSPIRTARVKSRTRPLSPSDDIGVFSQAKILCRLLIKPLCAEFSSSLLPKSDFLF